MAKKNLEAWIAGLGAKQQANLEKLAAVIDDCERIDQPIKIEGGWLIGRHPKPKPVPARKKPTRAK